MVESVYLSKRLDVRPDEMAHVARCAGAADWCLYDSPPGWLG